MSRIAVIIAAGGSSVRFGRNKLLENLQGVTVFERSIASLYSHASIDHIFVATQDPALVAIARSFPSARLTICPTGATRAETVKSALERVPEVYDWVAVHDAARPLLSVELISRTIHAALEHGAAVPALPVQLTIKQATGPLPARVERTVPRQQLWAMQTPQIMRRVDLLRAFENCPIPLDQVTDDAQLLELIGLPVWLVAGDERNLKITTPIDLKVARAMMD